MIEDGKSEIKLVERRNRRDPQKLKVRIGRIEERKHIVVDGQVEHHSPQMFFFFSPVFVGYQEISFFPQKGNILTKYTPILAESKIIIKLKKYGDIQREARKEGFLRTPYFQAGVPVKFCNQSSFP